MKIQQDEDTIQVSPIGYAKRWSKCKEQKSSSPSGGHFGYKCLIRMSNQVQEIFAHMLNIPARTGYSPTRWRKAIDVLLMKNPNDHRVHRTRPIPLLEADGNDSFKLLASQATHLAEEHNLHAPKQYGGKAFMRQYTVPQLKTASTTCQDNNNNR